MAWREAGLPRKCAHIGRSIRVTGQSIVELIDTLDGRATGQ